jgi:hypothetical protein
LDVGRIMQRFISSSLAGCFLALAAACATEAPLSVRRNNGPPLFIVPSTTCQSDLGGGPGPTAVPDTALCEEVAAALKQALRDVGYRVVESPEDPHVANVRIAARQASGPLEGRATALLAVQVVIESGGAEIDRAVEDGDAAATTADTRMQLRSFARVIAQELARSPRMKDAGLAPGS